MTDEMKLLRAFIEAQGFEIEEVDINPMRHDRYPSTPTYEYKLTKKEYLNHEHLLSRYLKYINYTYLEAQDEHEALKHFTLAELKELKRLENENI